jgi:hypothetical protein
MPLQNPEHIILAAKRLVESDRRSEIRLSGIFSTNSPSSNLSQKYTKFATKIRDNYCAKH